MMISMTQTVFLVLILLTAAERIYELFVSRNHASIAFSQGGVEYGKSHFPAMVLLHTGLLAGALIEVFVFERDFLAGFGWLFLGIAIACQGARYWIIWALGKQWNTRVIVIPGASLVRRGPYRFSWLRHPNYWVVAIEGIALPMVHGAWVTALVFTVLNAILLLGFRIPAENKALRSLK